MKLWGKDKVKMRKLKLKVRGEIAQVPVADVKNEFAELDKEVQRFESVLGCLSTIDKSLITFNDKDGIYISLQCRLRLCVGNKDFCRDVVNLMGEALTKEMSMKTRVDTLGFIDFSR